MTDTPALSLQGVTVEVGHRRTTQLLRDVDLQVEVGQTVVLLGTSGAGKTTLLRVVAGLQRPTKGRVMIGDRCVDDGETNVPPEERGVGLVFQGLELWPHLSVAEHIAFGMTPRRKGRAAAKDVRVLQLMEQVGLPTTLGRRRPATLSGGEQQRVAIARALGAEPSVMLYDEPLASLDPERRRALRKLLRTLQRTRNVSTIYVSHDPEDAIELGDHVAILANGCIVEEGEPTELYRRPATVEGARALGRATLLSASFDGNQVSTPFGNWSAQDLPGGNEGVAFWRPEDIEVVDNTSGESATVMDVVSIPGGRFVVESHLLSEDGVAIQDAVYAQADHAPAIGDAVRLNALHAPTWIPMESAQPPPVTPQEQQPANTEGVA